MWERLLAARFSTPLKPLDVGRAQGKFEAPEPPRIHINIERLSGESQASRRLMSKLIPGKGRRYLDGTCEIKAWIVNL